MKHRENHGSPKAAPLRLVVDPTNPENLITRRAAAVMLGICTRTVYRYEREGDLKAFRQHARATSYRLGDVVALREKWGKTAQASSPFVPAPIAPPKSRAKNSRVRKAA